MCKIFNTKSQVLETDLLLSFLVSIGLLKQKHTSPIVNKLMVQIDKENPKSSGLVKVP